MRIKDKPCSYCNKLYTLSGVHNHERQCKTRKKMSEPVMTFSYEELQVIKKWFYRFNNEGSWEKEDRSLAYKISSIAKEYSKKNNLDN